MYITIHEPSGPRTISSEAAFEEYKKGKTLIEAAGGLVLNEKGELLMIFRRGHWDLPKGKVDEGETLEQCALREVSEETGLKNLTLVKHVYTTYHTYSLDDSIVLKPSHWFLIHHQGDEELVPQTEEDIAEIRWVKKEETRSLVDQAYASISELLERFYFNSI